MICLKYILTLTIPLALPAAATVPQASLDGRQMGVGCERLDLNVIVTDVALFNETDAEQRKGGSRRF